MNNQATGTAYRNPNSKTSYPRSHSKIIKGACLIVFLTLVQGTLEGLLIDSFYVSFAWDCCELEPDMSHKTQYYPDPHRVHQSIPHTRNQLIFHIQYIVEVL